jgi:hypothetical protein
MDKKMVRRTVDELSTLERIFLTKKKVLSVKRVFENEGWDYLRHIGLFTLHPPLSWTFNGGSLFLPEFHDLVG